MIYGADRSGGAPAAEETVRSTVIACQVCGQDQTLTDSRCGEKSSEETTIEMYIMECCFSVVCRECNGISGGGGCTTTSNYNSNAMPAAAGITANGDVKNENNQEEQAPKKTAKICLACLEPVKATSDTGGKVALSLAKYSVLANLLASINETQKKVAMSHSKSNSLFGYITGASTASKPNNQCHRCQVNEHQYVCITCSGGGSNEPTKLCADCNTLMHSLGDAYKAHKVHESIGQKFKGDSTQEGTDDDEEGRKLLTLLANLEECPKHKEPIEYYLEEELAESETPQIELPGVAYGCHRCTTTLENGASFTRIDKENLLNVYQLKQELFKEQQSSLSTLTSMMTNFNLDIVDKLPQLKALETQQVRDVFTRIIKTLTNKQLEIEQQIEDRFQKLSDHVHKEKQRLLTKKEVVERNYNLLERALEVVPLPILSCEEGLLEAMLLANQTLMKNVKAQETKIAMRRALFTPRLSDAAAESGAASSQKQDPPFHLIEPEQMRGRLKTMETFATKIDAIIAELFKQATNQINQEIQVVTTPVIASSHHQAAYPSGTQHSIAASQNNPILSQSSPYFKPGVIASLDQSQRRLSYQTPIAVGASQAAPVTHHQQTQETVQSNSIDTTNPVILAEAAQQLFNSQQNDAKRQSVMTTKSGVLSAFVTQQNQAKSRMQRDALVKSQLSIGNTSSLDLDVGKSTSAAQRYSRKVGGGTSRRDQSYGASGTNEPGERDSSAHQAYLVQHQSSATASQRYINNAVIPGSAKNSKLTSTTSTGKWDSSTRVYANQSRRDQSVNSTNQGGSGTSVPRNQQKAGDRSMNRSSVNLGNNNRNGAHSTVGQSERWNQIGKRDSNLNISQDMSGGNLANLKNGTSGDGSPRASRNRSVVMGNLQPSKERSMGIIDPEKQIIKENVAHIEQNCLASRVFTHVAQTSTAIQVAWSHPSNFQKVVTVEDESGQKIQQKQHIQYILEYGIGVKVDNKEQFRQIYKGKAHKCIITDLMPRTTFRLRVAPILNVEKGIPVNSEASSTQQSDTESRKTVTRQEKGEWSDVTNITTKETQTFDVGGILSTTSPKAPNLMCAQLITKGRKKWLAFDKAGTLIAAYGYSFGEHLWCLKIQYQEHQTIQQHTSGQATSALDQSGSMVIGVVNKRFSNQKMFGSVINYSIFKGEIVVKIYLDSNKKRLIIYSPQHPQGDVFSDLPKDGLFFPAVQNKTSISKQKSSLKVFFKFDQLIPKDKTEIGGQLVYSSDDGVPDNSTNDELSQSASMIGSSTPASTQQKHGEESKSRRVTLTKGGEKSTGRVTSSSGRGGGQVAASGTSSRTTPPVNMKESQITQTNAQTEQ